MESGNTLFESVDGYLSTVKASVFHTGLTLLIGAKGLRLGKVAVTGEMSSLVSVRVERTPPSWDELGAPPSRDVELTPLSWVVEQ